MRYVMAAALLALAGCAHTLDRVSMERAQTVCQAAGHVAGTPAYQECFVQVFRTVSPGGRP